MGTDLPSTITMELPANFRSASSFTTVLLVPVTCMYNGSYYCYNGRTASLMIGPKKAWVVIL